jgi:hypothetical protein
MAFLDEFVLPRRASQPLGSTYRKPSGAITAQVWLLRRVGAATEWPEMV